jgi:hypothetical protein
MISLCTGTCTPMWCAYTHWGLQGTCTGACTLGWCELIWTWMIDVKGSYLCFILLKDCFMYIWSIFDQEYSPGIVLPWVGIVPYVLCWYYALGDMLHMCIVHVLAHWYIHVMCYIYACIWAHTCYVYMLTYMCTWDQHDIDGYWFFTWASFLCFILLSF